MSDEFPAELIERCAKAIQREMAQAVLREARYNELVALLRKARERISVFPQLLHNEHQRMGGYPFGTPRLGEEDPLLDEIDAALAGDMKQPVPASESGANV